MIATAVDHEARLSAMEAFVRPRLRISIRALALGRAVSELSTGTFREALHCADLRALTKLTQSEWEESLVQFKHEKLANLERKLLRPTWRAFATFDPIFRGTDPVSDGAAIASIVADATEEPLIQAVAEKTKLPQRQFNPAMQFLTETTDGGVRRTINGEWCFLPSHVGRWLADDRYKFRRVSENATDLAIGLSQPRSPPATIEMSIAETRNLASFEAGFRVSGHCRCFPPAAPISVSTWSTQNARSAIGPRLTEGGSKIFRSCIVAPNRCRSSGRTICPFQHRADHYVPHPATISISGALTRRAIRNSVVESRSLISAPASLPNCKTLAGGESPCGGATGVIAGAPVERVSGASFECPGARPLVRFERKPGARAESLDALKYGLAAEAALSLNAVAFNQRADELRSPVPIAPAPSVIKSRWMERRS